MAAQAVAKTAEAKRVEAAKAAKDAKLALEPVSIFISRATGKLYVRRDTHERVPDGGERFDATLEVPVTIRRSRQADRYARLYGGRAHRGRLALDRGHDRRRRRAPKMRSTALASRRRCSIALRRPRCRGPRSSSRTSRSNSETNYRTEFVVVLNNQPQGGLAMRKPPPEVEPAFGNGGDNGFFSSFNRWHDWNSEASQDSATRQRRGQSYYPGQPGSW